MQPMLKGNCLILQRQQREVQPSNTEEGVNSSCSQQFCTLLNRDLKHTLRNPLLAQLRLIQMTIVSLCIAGVCARFSDDYMDLNNWRALTGFFFFVGNDLMMQAIAPVQLVFPLERSVFLKEESSKMYGTLAYWMSRNVIQLPYTLVLPLVYVLILYWFVGLSNTVEQFFTFYLIACLISFNGSSLGMLMGSIVTDAKSIASLTTIILMPLFVFSGFFKNRGNLPVWCGWIQYLSPNKYSFSAMTQNEVLYSAQSRIDQLNFDLGLWASIGLLFSLSMLFRLVSLLFLWLLRAKLQ